MAFVNLAQALFPIGSIYLSSTSVSPANMLGGTWSRIQGANLYACDSTIGAASYGGSKTISISQLPAHYHEPQVYTTESGSATVPAWKLYIERWNTGGALRSNGSTEKTGCSVGTTSFGNTSSAGGGATFIPYSYGVYAWIRMA